MAHTKGHCATARLRAFVLNSAWAFTAAFPAQHPPFGAELVKSIAAANVLTLAVMAGIVVLCARPWQGPDTADRPGRSDPPYAMLQDEHL